VRTGFYFYYKKIETRYHEEIPRNKPVLFLSNHQNALLDPLLITVNSTRKNFFLTRADVFTNKMIRGILNSLQMLPVYRVRDGIRTITKNKSIFTRCSEVLHQDQSIILFPEGNHSLNRTVRPLSKGFTRIIDAYLSKDDNEKLIIIPVGLNYQTPKDYGDSVAIHFGRPIDPRSYLKNKLELDIPGLKDRVREDLKTLTTHIDDQKDYDSMIMKLNQMKVDFTKPEPVNEYLRTGQYKGNQLGNRSSLFSIMKVPVILFHLIPYLFWKFIFSPKIKDEEFIGTYRYAVCITLAPFFLIVEAILIALLFNGWYAFYFILAGILFPLLALRLK